MSQKTILQEIEVLELGKIPRLELGMTHLSDIFQIEMAQRRKVLGKTFYDAIKSDVVDYSGTNEYQKGASYLTGQNVLFNGRTYTAKNDTTKEPTYTQDWSRAKKFNNDYYNELWYNFLGRYFSLIVIRQSVMKNQSPMSSAGNIKLNGEVFESAKRDDVIDFINFVEGETRLTLENMIDYISEQQGKFPVFLAVEERKATSDKNLLDCNESGAGYRAPSGEDSYNIYGAY